MKPIAIPEHVADAMGGQLVTIGGQPGEDVTPCDYVVTASTLYPGRPAVHALVELNDDDRAKIAAGHGLWLTMDGGELPWSITLTGTPIPPPTP